MSSQRWGAPGEDHETPQRQHGVGVAECSRAKAFLVRKSGGRSNDMDTTSRHRASIVLLALARATARLSSKRLSLRRGGHHRRRRRDAALQRAGRGADALATNPRVRADGAQATRAHSPRERGPSATVAGERRGRALPRRSPQCAQVVEVSGRPRSRGGSARAPAGHVPVRPASVISKRDDSTDGEPVTSIFLTLVQQGEYPVRRCIGGRQSAPSSTAVRKRFANKPQKAHTRSSTSLPRALRVRPPAPAVPAAAVLRFALRRRWISRAHPAFLLCSATSCGV